MIFISLYLCCVHFRSYLYVDKVCLYCNADWYTIVICNVSYPQYCAEESMLINQSHFISLFTPCDMGLYNRLAVFSTFSVLQAATNEVLVIRSTSNRKIFASCLSQNGKNAYHAYAYCYFYQL